MKKIIAMLALTAMIFGACTTSEVQPVTVSLSKTSATESGLAASSKSMMVTVTNNSNQSATINWERSEMLSPTGWTYTVNTNSGMSGTLTIAAGASQEITLVVMPNSVAGTGTGEIKFYDSADQGATTKTFAYSYSAVSALFELVIVDTNPMDRFARVTDPISANDYLMKIYNPNTTPVTVTWELENDANNTPGWDTYLCDPVQCWTPTILTSTFTVQPSDSAEFKLTIDHKGNTGKATATAIAYAPSDSAQTRVSQVTSLEVN